MLLPGLVDTHVHVNEPGRTEWEGFASATRAAAAGGVTTIVDMPLNSIPPTTTVAALEAKRARRAGQAFVDVGFWGGAVPGNLADLAPLHDAGVFGFKCFLLDSGVEEFPHLDAAGLAAAMAETAGLGALLIVHAEDADEIDDARAPHGRRYAGFLGSRPARGRGARRSPGRRAAGHRRPRPRRAPQRADAVCRCCARARRRASTCHRRDLPALPDLRRRAIPDGATEFKCCPPIRDAANRDALWAGLADGDIDLRGHRPLAVHADLKRRDTGDFGAAWGGIASLQLGLPVVWTGARERGAPAGRRGPLDGDRARRPGRAGRQGPDRGRRRRRPVRLAPDEAFVVDPARLHHKNPVSAYAGRTLTGTVRAPGCAAYHRPRRCPARAAAEEGMTMGLLGADEAGCPPQTDLTTDRAVFTEAYAMIPRGTHARHHRQPLPHWDAPGCGCWPGRCRASPRPSASTSSRCGPAAARPARATDPDAEAVLFVVGGTVALTVDGDDHAWAPAATPTSAGRPGRCATTDGRAATFHWIRKAYERVDGVDAPGVRDPEHDVARSPMPDTDGAWATQRFVDPTTSATTCTSTSSASSRAADPVPGDPRDGARPLRPRGQGGLPAQQPTGSRCRPATSCGCAPSAPRPATPAARPVPLPALQGRQPPRGCPL